MATRPPSSHHRLPALALAALLASILLPACTSTPKPDPNAPLVWVQIDTTLGPIILELDRAHAPVTVNNFLAYADARAYDNTIVHRVMRDFVIQGGGYTTTLVELPGNAPIPNEWLSGLKNTRGTIAMARETEPNSATRQWYINVADNPRLDTPREITGNAGYAVFGRVVDGMDVVDAIRALPVREAQAQNLAPGSTAANPIYVADTLQNVPADLPVIRTVRRVNPPR